MGNDHSINLHPAKSKTSPHLWNLRFISNVHVGLAPWSTIRQPLRDGSGGYQGLGSSQACAFPQREVGSGRRWRENMAKPGETCQPQAHYSSPVACALVASEALGQEDRLPWSVGIRPSDPDETPTKWELLGCVTAKFRDVVFEQNKRAKLLYF